MCTLCLAQSSKEKGRDQQNKKETQQKLQNNKHTHFKNEEADLIREHLYRGRDGRSKSGNRVGRERLKNNKEQGKGPHIPNNFLLPS